MNALRLSVRVLAIGVLVLGALITYLWNRISRRSERRDEARGRVLASLLERLGATFVKFGQILSSRPDLLSEGYTKHLARLQDAVAPAGFDELEPVLKSELGVAYESLNVDRSPVASASVAQVHKATTASGEVLALKIQRPRARHEIERDLAVLSMGAAFVNLIPTVKLLSLPGSVRQFGIALRGQLDFRAEARNNRRFAENFAAVEGVRVPDLHDELCTERVLAMEFVDGVKATEPERVGGDRITLARRGAEAILKMVFTDGFVHADLHPGNILLTNKGEVVLIDLGLITEFPDDYIRIWVETFMALSMQKGEHAARLFYGYAPTIGPNLDYPTFERDVCDNLELLYGKAIGDVEVGQAVGGMMNVLRKHRVQIDPVFTVAHLAMLVAEGLGKQLDPTLDIIPLAGPYLAKAMVEAPPARPPLRDVPASAALVSIAAE